MLPAACTIAVISLSGAAILVRWSQAPAVTLAMYRMLFSAPFLLGMALRAARKGNRKRNGIEGKGKSEGMGQSEVFRGAGVDLRDFLGMLLSGIFLAGHFGLWIASLDYSSVAISVLLVSLHPVIVGGLGRLIGEKAPPGFGLALLLVAPGTILIALGDQFGSTAVSSSPLGIVLALGGACMMSGYLLVGRMLRRRLSTRIYAGGTYGFGAAILILVSLITGTPILAYPAQEYLIFAALALIPTLLGHTLLNWALKYVPSAGISLLYLGEPIGASLFAALLFAEIPGPAVIAGGGLVLWGLFFLGLKNLKQTARYS